MLSIEGENTMSNARAVKEILTDRSIAWNVEWSEGTSSLIVGCVDQNAAELLAECLNEAAWIQVDVGETLGTR